MTNKETREIKEKIKGVQDQIANLIIESLKDEEKKLKEEVAVLKAELLALRGKLNEIKENPTGSTATEFHPHKGFNRRQARAFRRGRRG